MKYQRPVLLVALLATVVAALLAPDPATQVVEVVARADDMNKEKPSVSEHKPDLALKRADLSAPLVLFSTPPIVAPEVVVLPPPPPAPQAPPLPFRVLGRYVDQQGAYVFLGNEQRGIAVRVGDVIDGFYEVRAIEGQSMRLVYLPLRQDQVLDIGALPSLTN